MKSSFHCIIRVPQNSKSTRRVGSSLHNLQIDGIEIPSLSMAAAHFFEVGREGKRLYSCPKRRECQEFVGSRFVPRRRPPHPPLSITKEKTRDFHLFVGLFARTFFPHIPLPPGPIKLQDREMLGNEEFRKEFWQYLQRDAKR